MKKALIKYNQIAHLCADYQTKVQHLSNFYQQLPFEHDYTVLESVDLDHTFQELRSLNPDWVVVVSLGHCTQNRNLYDELIEFAAQTPVKPLVGHLMNFPDQFPHLHPQLFVVNYQTWLQTGARPWGYRADKKCFVGTIYHASEQTFHDSYTPAWITPEIQAVCHHVTEMQIGAEVINGLLMHDHTVYNIPEHIRQHKFHLYPDQTHAEFHDFLSGQPYTGDNPAQTHYAEFIGHLADQVQKQFYVLNTEPLTDLKSPCAVNHYAGVASGLKLFCTMVKNGFDHDTAVTFFDFSAIALQFQQFLKSQWNGNLDQYQIMCKRFEQQNPGHFPCLPTGAWSEYYDHMLQQLSVTPAEFQQHWLRFTKLHVQYTQLNLYDAQDQHVLAQLCGTHDVNYVWISNAFYMEYSLITLGMDQLHTIREQLLSALKHTGASIILDCNDHWSQQLITFNTHDSSSN